MAFRSQETDRGPESEGPMLSITDIGGSLEGRLLNIRENRVHGELTMVMDFEASRNGIIMPGRYFSIAKKGSMNQLGLEKHIGQIIRLTFTQWVDSDKSNRKYKKYELEVWE